MTLVFDKPDGKKEIAHILFPSEEAAQAALVALDSKPLRVGGPPMEFGSAASEENTAGFSVLQTGQNNALRVAGLGRRTSFASFKAFFQDDANSFTGSSLCKPASRISIPAKGSIACRYAMVRSVSWLWSSVLRLSGKRGSHNEEVPGQNIP